LCKSLHIQRFSWRCCVNESCSDISRLVFSRCNSLKYLDYVHIGMQRLGFNTFFFPAISCFISVLLGRLFFYLVCSTVCLFQALPLLTADLPEAALLKRPFSSLWHTFSAQLLGSDAFPFPKGASYWVVFLVWHSFCIKALLWQQCQKAHCSRDFSPVSSWQCLELPFCLPKLLDASGLYLWFAGAAA